MVGAQSEGNNNEIPRFRITYDKINELYMMGKPKAFMKQDLFIQKI